MKRRQDERAMAMATARGMAMASVLAVGAVIGAGVMAIGGCSRGGACCDVSGPERTAAERVSDATLFETAPSAEKGGVAGEVGSVGVFDRTKVLMAYYRSARHEEQINALQRERDAAKARGDTAEAERCEREGQERQHVAHLQLVRKAPMDNIARDYGREIERVAREAGVKRVIAQDAHTVAGGSGTVDVTEALVRAMGKKEGR